jgi:hypothetical protein
MCASVGKHKHLYQDARFNNKDCVVCVTSVVFLMTYDEAHPFRQPNVSTTTRSYDQKSICLGATNGF